MKTMNEFASVLTIGSLVLAACVAGGLLSSMPQAASHIRTVFAGSSPRPLGVPDEPPAVAELMEDAPRVAANCEQCGVVASMREIRQAEGAVDARGKPGVIRGSLKETAVEATPRYEVTVRMQDGSQRVFVHAAPAIWRTRERLILIGGAVHASN